MKKHLLCLTLDTDPDGLNAKVPNRRSLEWGGLEYVQRLPAEVARGLGSERIPITWFVRADGQLESILGSAVYVLETYAKFWEPAQECGDELAWHPHLYRQTYPEDPALIITDPTEAQDEIHRLWNLIKTTFRPTAFRNGEGWHLPETYDAVERLGFRCDSTVIPGRRGPEGHPMNWEGAPNQPYFPGSANLCAAAAPRPLLELPMNSWLVQAPYDRVPRTRYMNPAVHPYLFANALKTWENACKATPLDLHIWVMIFHPEEVLPSRGTDSLYSRSISDLVQNLSLLVQSLRNLGHGFEWLTISDAAERWRKTHQQAIA